MAKINLDKYYTPDSLAKYCVDKVKEVLWDETITEWLEPSAGNGAFLPYLDNNYLAFDLEPEHEMVEKKDYLTLDIPYFKGRCIVGNPPFGSGNTLSVKFFKNSLKYGDFIAFILPASQYNNNQQMYEFDLFHSEMLEITKYSGINLQCCFNIYKRPLNGLNEKPFDYKLKDVTVLEWRRGSSYSIPNTYHLGICAWGASIGKEIKYQWQFAREMYIQVKNCVFKEAILEKMKQADWKKIHLSISAPSLSQWKIYKYLREQIPELR